MDWKIIEDFIIALVGFYIIRYLLPNKILKKDTDIKSGFVYAICYSLFGLINSFINLYRKNELEYYHLHI